MKGTLALAGAGEFLDTMNEVDRELLRRAGRRVLVLPTASAPDGPGVPERWLRMGVEHFQALGAQAEGLLALDHAALDDPTNADHLRRADLIYFSGGKPDYLRQALEGTAAWTALTEVLARGGAVAGCSAGAMIMGAYVPDFSMRFGPPSVKRWNPSFGLVPNAIILPHYNEFPEITTDLLFGHRPERTFVVGIDAHTVLLGSADGWEAAGKGRVTVRRGREVRRYTAGDKVALPAEG